MLTQLNNSLLFTDLSGTEIKSKRNKHTCRYTHVRWLSQCVFCSASQSDSYTHQTVISERQTCHTHASTSDRWHEDCLNTEIWIAAFTEGGFKENSLLKQIHCMQPLAQCSNSTLIMVALSPTDTFTYRRTNIHAHKCTVMQRESSQTGQIFSPHLTFVGCTVTPNSNVWGVCVSGSPLLDLWLPFSHSLLNL